MTTTMTLPDGVTITPTALTFSRELSFDEWKSLGSNLKQFESSLQWWIGDWWHHGEHKYGERKKLAADAFGYEFGTLMNFGYVAGSVEASLRNEALSFPITFKSHRSNRKNRNVG